MTETLMGEGGVVTPQIEIVQSKEEGVLIAKEIIYQNCGANSALFLSGGQTPNALYEALTKEKVLIAAKVAMVDERITPDFSKRNETMIRESGLVSYLQSRRIPFHPIYPDFHSRLVKLPANLRYPNRALLRELYDGMAERLLDTYKRIAILGLGADGHIASLPAGVKNAKLQSARLVEDYNNFPVEPRERISLTPKALSRMDLLILLAFGKEKKPGLDSMFSNGKVEDAPGRLLTTGEMAGKTILITDQPVSPVARRGGKV